MTLDRLLQLYASYSGRISQEQFWVAFLWIVLPVMAVEALLSLLMYYQLGPMNADAMAMVVLEPGDAEYDQAFARFFEPYRWVMWFHLGLFAVIVVPLTAISVKRRHDRGARGISVWLYALAWLFIYAGFATIDPSRDGLDALGPFGALPFFGIPVVLVLSIYLLVTLGILEGTAGPNRYGPDPLVRKPVATPRV
jgi:uncharacterized membrane protein YhaH (DUF805 family)